MSRDIRFAVVVLAGVLALSPTGCGRGKGRAEGDGRPRRRVEVSTSGGADRRPDRGGGGGRAARGDANGAARGGPVPAELTADDPCATRLHDVAGLMLAYYAAHRRLPDQLDELQATGAAFGLDVEFTCPQTGEPYVYVPAGLSFPGRDERVVLHDASAGHDGSRRAVVARDARGGQAATMWAVELPEKLFRQYRGGPEGQDGGAADSVE